jgi:hypothetical protein
MQYDGQEIWVVLESYDRETDELVHHVRIDHLIDLQVLLRAIGVSSVDDLVLGAWRIHGSTARELESHLDIPIADATCEVFVGAQQPEM